MCLWISIFSVPFLGPAFDKEGIVSLGNKTGITDHLLLKVMTGITAQGISTPLACTRDLQAAWKGYCFMTEYVFFLFVFYPSDFTSPLFSFLFLFPSRTTHKFLSVKKRAARSLIRGVAVRISQGSKITIDLCTLMLQKEAKIKEIKDAQWLDLMVIYGDLSITPSVLQAEVNREIGVKSSNSLERLLHQLLIREIYSLPLGVFEPFQPLLTSSVAASGGEWHDGALLENLANLF
jgi:hypothetical protein